MILVLVDNDARKAVGFAPDKTTKVFFNREGIAVVNGLSETTSEEFLVQFLFSPRNSARHDLGVWIVDRHAERAVLEVLEGDEITGFGLPKGLLDFRRVDPLMSVEDTGARFDDKTWHGGRKGHGRGEIKTWRAFSLDHLAEAA